MKYLSLEEVIILHDSQIVRFGGLEGIRDLALLESATLRPHVAFGGKDMFNSIPLKAAVLAHGIIMNHPFVDANKRTGMHAAITFLELNGVNCNLTDNEVVDIAIRVATNKLTITELAKIFAI